MGQGREHDLLLTDECPPSHHMLGWQCQPSMLTCEYPSARPGGSDHDSDGREPVIGRTVELGEIVELASTVTQRGRALVIEGEAGIGKTTLLDAVGTSLTDKGFTVLSCAGVQCQRSVGYAAVHELVHPILGYADALPPHQRTALLAAFGLAEHAMPDPLLIGVAMLGLIEEAASHHPLLLLVDDAQWLDGSSLHVLTFVGRRLMNSPVLVLGAARPRLDGEPARLVSLTRMPLGPVDEVTARTLMSGAIDAADGTHQLTELTKCRILEEACGNPLAITELTKAVIAHGCDDPVFGSTPLPTTRRIERVFLEQLDSIDETSRQWLALISAAEDVPLTEVIAAAQHLGLAEHHRDPLERNGLISVLQGRFQVRHPLLRSVAYRSAALSQRSSFHRALADATTDPVRSAWQHSAATYGPDDDVATEMEAAALRAQRHGAHAEAAAAFRRAAVLSTAPDHRLRRLICAIEPAGRAGLTLEAIDILADAEPLARELDDLEHLGSLALARFRLGATVGVAAASAPDLVTLADRLAAAGDRASQHAQIQILAAAAGQCRLQELSAEECREVVRRLNDISQLGIPGVDIALATVDGGTHAHRFRASAAAIRTQIDGDASALMSMGLAATSIGDLPTALQCWEEALQVARSGRSPALECEALRGLAWTQILAGNLHEATVSAQRALQIATDANMAISAGAAAALLARAQVCRGETRFAQQNLADARRNLPSDAPLPWLNDLAWTSGLLALSVHSHQDALTELSKLTPHRYALRWAVADLTEAAVASRHIGSIAETVEAVASEVSCLGSGYLSMLVHRSRALLAGPDRTAEAHFRAALAEQDTAADAPLEFARTQLCFGEWLRRQRRIVDARAQLSDALRTFESLDAVPWAQRTRTELRAAGVHLPGLVTAHTHLAEELTPQELEIARLAASGMSNRQIADRIYVSHRTVAAHLYKVFPKLGITSRHQLRDALDGDAVLAG